MKDYYASEKFSSAVRGMAVSPKSIQHRLADAYVYNLIHVEDDKVPEEIQADFRKLKERLRDVAPLAGEGGIQPMSSNMSDDEARTLASQIVDMYFQVESALNAD